MSHCFRKEGSTRGIVFWHSYERAVQPMQNGVSYDEAVELVDSNEAFREWYKFVKELASKY